MISLWMKRTHFHIRMGNAVPSWRAAWWRKKSLPVARKTFRKLQIASCAFIVSCNGASFTEKEQVQINNKLNMYCVEFPFLMRDLLCKTSVSIVIQD